MKLPSVQQNSEMYEEDIALLEQYFVVMYSVRRNATDVSTCRKIRFAEKENICPTSAALRQYIL